MWRLTLFLYLLIIYGHTLSHSITDNAENGRQTRQLDFGECCPCPGAGDLESSDISTQESPRHPSEHTFARARDLNDCPCRTGHPDSEGASSFLFPSSMRSDGPVVRLIEKNEEPKPLLHPEVDLASSVLQTLHEATDEEYQNALVRDAARSVAKAAEETFGDAISEASTGNMVTIIVKPKHTNSIDDVLPQETHVQESHCVNTPIKGIRKKIGITRPASKPPSLIRKMFGLPKISNPLEVDSSIGASNFNEHVVHIDDDPSSNRGTELRRKYVPLIKSNLDYENIASLNMNNKVENEDSSINKVPNFKLFSVHDKLNDMLSKRSSMDNRKSYLPFIPNIRENNSFKKQKSNPEDRNLLLDNNQTQTIDNISFFRSKPHLENILRKTRPDLLKNLLKLKDAEVIPLKERVAAKHRNINVPLLKLPAINKKTDTPAFTIFKKKENIEMLPKSSNTEIFDHEGSPNNLIEQFSDDCDGGDIKTTERLHVKDANDEISSTDIIDTEPSPSNIQSTVADRYTDFNNSYSHEFVNSAKDSEVKTLPGTETNFPQTTDSCLHNEAQRSNEEELNIDNINNAEGNQNQDINDKLNTEECVDDKNETDSVTDSSDNLNNIVKSTENMSQTSDESLVSEDVTEKKTYTAENQVNDNFKTLDSITLHSLEKSLSSLKQNIIKKLEDLKNHKSGSRNPNTFVKKIITDDIKHKETASDSKTKSNADCESENLQENKESTQISTLKPEDLENAKESPNEISMQDLQNISDSMLQQEEQKRESETAVCSEPIKEVIDSEMPLRDNSREKKTSDTEQSANSQNEIQIEPTNFVDSNKDEEKFCQSNLPNPADVNVEASGIVMNKVSTPNNILESPVLLKEVLQPRENHLNLFKNPFPDLQDIIKIGPLPSLDDITQRLSSLFDVSGSNVDFMTRSSSDLGSPIMETDESINDFQSRFPFLKLEDVNFDILQLKPPSNFLSKIPNIDLHSYKTKLPIPKDLRFKPIKLQSALEDKGSILGAILTLGQSKVRPNSIHKVNRVSENLWESIPNLNDKTRVQKVLNFPQKPHNLINRLSDFSDNSNTWRKVQHGLESRIKEAIKNPIKQKSPNFFEQISTNHEDLNDKLKALHIDLNDRIETMRNHFKDKFELGPIDTYNRKPIVKSFSGFNNQNKERSQERKKLTGYSKPAPKRESKNTLNRRLNQQRQSKIEYPLKLRNHQKYNMSPSANVPIPRTIKVPELKTTLMKSPEGLQRTSGANRNEETLPPITSSVTLLRRTGNTLRNNNSPIGKQINAFKDSKIKDSFSTTPRLAKPIVQRPSKMKLSLSDINTAKNRGKFRIAEDHNESPSELRHSLIKPPIFYDVVNSDLERSKNRFNEQILQRKEPTLGRKKNFDGETTHGNSLIDFKPRSQIMENSFLMNVKEAVKTTILNQLSQVNSPSTLKNSDIQSDVDIDSCLNKEDDMSRSASEDTDVVEGHTLKENISYKCKMVCTKE